MPTTAAQPVAHARAGRAVLVLAAAASAYSILQSLVVPAIDTLQEELRIGPLAAGWIFTTYLLTASVLTPLLGRLGDLVGKREVLTGALLLLAAGAVISALATTFPLMIAGRVVQGFGGGVFPLVFALVRDVLPAEKRAGTLAVVTAALTVTGALGTVVAGVVLQVLDYHWLFWLPAGLTLAAAAGTWWAIPRTAPQPQASRDLGWASASLLSLWLTLLLLGISALPSTGLTAWPALGALAGAGVVAASWVRAELRAEHPLVDVRLLWRPALRATNTATLLLGAGMFSAWMLVPLLLQQSPETGVGLGVSPLAVGAFMLANAAGAFVATPFVNPLARHAGPRAPVVTGSAIAASAYVLLAARHGTAADVVTGLLVEGVGIGLAFAGIAGLVVDHAPHGRTGVISGMNTICRTIGGAIGTTACAALLTHSATGGSAPGPAVYQIAFAGFAAALALSAVAAWQVPPAPEPVAAPA